MLHSTCGLSIRQPSAAEGLHPEHPTAHVCAVAPTSLQETCHPTVSAFLIHKHGCLKEMSTCRSTCSRRHDGSSTVSRRNRMCPCDDQCAGRISGDDRPHVGGAGRSRLCLCVRDERAERSYSRNALLESDIAKRWKLRNVAKTLPTLPLELHSCLELH